MSDSVSKALLLTGGCEAFKTAVFIGKVDKFFDCLNVTSYTIRVLSQERSFRNPTSTEMTLVLRYQVDFVQLNMLRIVNFTVPY